MVPTKSVYVSPIESLEEIVSDKPATAVSLSSTVNALVAEVFATVETYDCPTTKPLLPAIAPNRVERHHFPPVHAVHDLLDV